MNSNDRLSKMVVLKLAKARRSPPTVVRLLMAWHSLPGLVIAGTICVWALLALRLPQFLAIFMAGVFVGAALRDVGMAFRTVRAWSIHEQLFDWQKIESLSGTTDAQPTANEGSREGPPS